jgi:hypothetical protein
VGKNKQGQSTPAPSFPPLSSSFILDFPVGICWFFQVPFSLLMAGRAPFLNGARLSLSRLKRNKINKRDDTEKIKDS